MGFDLDGYVDVAERIRIFREKYPEGSLQPLNPERPLWIEVVDGRSFVCYAAAAYRSPDDQRPGVGIAWEPFPGPTQFTRDSEAMNAETAAWGRAIVASLAADTQKVASAQEVRNRRADSAHAPDGAGSDRGSRPAPGRPATEPQLKFLNNLAGMHYVPEGCPWPLTEADGKTWLKLDAKDVSRWLDELKAHAKAQPETERKSTMRTDA